MASMSTSSKSRELQLRIDITGARRGEIVCGVESHPDVKGVVVEMVDDMPACDDIGSMANAEQLLAAYQREFGYSKEMASIVLADRLTRFQSDRVLSGGSGGATGARDLGRTCPQRKGDHGPEGRCTCPTQRFIIRQPGAWLDHARGAGRERDLMAHVHTATPVTWRDVLQCVGRKTLILRKGLYRLTVGTRKEVRDGREAYTIPTASHGDVQVVVPPSEAAPLENGRARGLALVAAAVGETREEIIAVAWDSLEGVTQGGLKSGLQKAARFGCPWTEVGREVPVPGAVPRAVIPTRVFLAACVIRLAMMPGVFVPEIQTFARGVTAAFKRVAVTMMEDAWGGTVEEHEALLSLAVVTAMVPTYHPPWTPSSRRRACWPTPPSSAWCCSGGTPPHARLRQCVSPTCRAGARARGE